MSGHLGERVTALVDGQLPPGQSERCYSHAAACRPCRDRIEVERLTKARLAALSPPPPAPTLTERLLQLSAPAGPVPPRVREAPGTARTRPVPGPGRAPRGSTRPRPSRPGGARRRPLRRVRVAGAVFGALSLLTVGAVGIAASSGAGSLPAVSPPVDAFVVEHAATVGGMPFVATPAGWGQLWTAAGDGR